MTHSKPSIVFCHGIWADGSCFNKLIPTLQAEGHQVTLDQGAVVRKETGREIPEMIRSSLAIPSSCLATAVR